MELPKSLVKHAQTFLISLASNRGMLMIEVAKEFNVRQLQVCAALCLWQFCRNIGIKHRSISELILHLVQMSSATNLPAWEQKGATLVITGRGDPIPNDITTILNPSILVDFNSLLEYSVEVGIVDMYGISTNKPINFLEKCIDILRIYGFKHPSFETLRKYKRGIDEWGEAISDTELRDILNTYGVTLSCED